MNLSLGSDPEFMLTNSAGELKSAIGVVRGTKEKKVSLGNGHMMFYDNVLVEVNITPGSTSRDVVANFSDCLKRLSKAVYPMRINLRASAKYPVAECQHPDAKVFGCEPEYDAYELQQVMPPTCEDSFRSAGGHMHLGVKKESWPLLSPITDGDRMKRDWGRVWVVRMLDLFVGIPSLFIDQDPTSPARRKLYGNAGTHRPKEEYGVEYRATSNFWLGSPKLVSLMYDLCNFTVDFVEANDHLKLWDVGDDPMEAKCKAYSIDDLKKAINSSNKDIAGKILKGVVKEQMPRALYTRVLEACEPRSSNFQKEWNLNF
jgi:Phage phiEco32-like COOH.NH2 ligase-type 2